MAVEISQKRGKVREDGLAQDKQAKKLAFVGATLTSQLAKQSFFPIPHHIAELITRKRLSGLK
jgi:hypothetical protein